MPMRVKGNKHRNPITQVTKSKSNSRSSSRSRGKSIHQDYSQVLSMVWAHEVEHSLSAKMSMCFDTNQDTDWRSTLAVRAQHQPLCTLDPQHPSSSVEPEKKIPRLEKFISGRFYPFFTPPPFSSLEIPLLPVFLICDGLYWKPATRN